MVSKKSPLLMEICIFNWEVLRRKKYIFHEFKMLKIVLTFTP